ERDNVVVLGADTAVVGRRTGFGKPPGGSYAKAMLCPPSGGRHDAFRGSSPRRGAVERRRVEKGGVLLLTPTGAETLPEIARGGGEGGDRAGAYAIQGLASRFIPRIEGSYSNIVGLPVASVFELLRGLPR